MERLELLEYCVPACHHTRGLPPAVRAGMGAGVMGVRNFPPRAGCTLSSGAHAHLHCTRSSWRHVGAVLVFGGYSETFFGMVQGTVGLGKGEGFWSQFSPFFFFFSWMNTLGRRRRVNQGELIFQGLRSSVKQNELSSFKVNDG